MPSPRDPSQRPQGGAADAARTRTLIEAYLAGDHRVEGELFERHRPQLLKHVRNNGRMRALRRYTSEEDVVDEAFLRALSSNILRDFEDRGPGSLRNMLLRIVERVMVDMRRRFEAQRRGDGRPTLSIESVREELPSLRESLASSDTTPTQALLGAELLRACRTALTGREGQVWELVNVQGVNTRDAGARLGLSEAAVRSLLFRARRRIQQHLQSMENGVDE